VEHSVRDLLRKLVLAGYLTGADVHKSYIGDLALLDAMFAAIEATDNGDNNDDDEAVADVAGPFSKEGDMEVYGRQIHWKASGYLKGIKWRYKAEARDKATGVTGKSSNHNSGKGAVEGAVKDLFAKLAAGGYLGETPVPAVGELVQLAGIFEEAGPSLTGIFDKEGDMEVYGRQIHWKASGYLKFINWRYKATARDKATGVTGGSSNFKSGKGAVEAAVKDLFNKLIAGGYIKPSLSEELRIPAVEEFAPPMPESVVAAMP